MATRYPIGYEIARKEIDRGLRWLTLRLKNVGDEPLTRLGVQLQSTDEYSVAMHSEGNFLESLGPGEEAEIALEKEVDYIVHAYLYDGSAASDTPRIGFTSPMRRRPLGTTGASGGIALRESDSSCEPNVFETDYLF